MKCSIRSALDLETVPNDILAFCGQSHVEGGAERASHRVMPILLGSLVIVDCKQRENQIKRREICILVARVNRADAWTPPPDHLPLSPDPQPRTLFYSVVYTCKMYVKVTCVLYMQCMYTNFSYMSYIKSFTFIFNF